jgi:hypothetical protein
MNKNEERDHPQKTKIPKPTDLGESFEKMIKRIKNMRKEDLPHPGLQHRNSDKK